MKKRKAVYEIRNYLTKEPRIKILRGLRGVGKTTMMLQTLKKTKGIYFSADWPTITNEGIYEIGKKALEAGYTHLFIDEVHTYPGWQDEIKALHDQFTKAHFFCSGSAAVAFIPDRRQKIFEIDPMSFGEYLEVGYGMKLEEEGGLWKDEQKSVVYVAKHYPEIEERFDRYLRFGGFPFSFNLEEADALSAIYYSTHKSIRQDSVSFLKMSREKVFAMEKLVILVATSNPGELSITSLSNNLDVSKSTIYEIIDALIRMKIIRLVRPYAKGSKLVRSEPKLLFVHPNIRSAICHMLKFEWSKGPIREEAALFGLDLREWKFYTIKGSKSSPDYRIVKGDEKYTLEIGGPSKGIRQLKGFEKPIIIKDDQLKVLLI
jgi:predicted AAA+ superfamily ATPase